MDNNIKNEKSEENFQYNVFNALIKKRLNLDYKVSYDTMDDLDTENVFKRYFVLFSIDKEMANNYLQSFIQRIGNVYFCKN